MRRNINTSKNNKSSTFHHVTGLLREKEGKKMGTKGRRNVKKPKKQKEKKEKGK